MLAMLLMMQIVDALTTNSGHRRTYSTPNLCPQIQWGERAKPKCSNGVVKLPRTSEFATKPWHWLQSRQNSKQKCWGWGGSGCTSGPVDQHTHLWLRNILRVCPAESESGTLLLCCVQMAQNGLAPQAHYCTPAAPNNGLTAPSRITTEKKTNEKIRN